MADRTDPAPSGAAPGVTLPIAGTRRRLLTAAASALIVPLVPRIAHAASIVAVRSWPAAEYTRVTLEMDRALKAEHFLLTGPHRLVVDLNGVDLNPQLRELVSKIQPGDPYIAGVRVGQNEPGVVRMVFDLKQTVVPQVFTLKPIGDYQHRLVLDLYPTQAASDPLMALLGPGDDDPLARIIEDLRTPRVDPVLPAATAPTPLPSPPTPPPRSSGGSSGGGSSRRRPILVMIDPGHGGEDPGAIGPSGTREKDIVLSISRLLKARLDGQAGMRAMLTRDGDYFVPLNSRVLKARRAQADLFISVHADAFTRASANGSSVYVLSQRGASSASARWLATKENEADLIGGIKLSANDALINQVLLDLSTTAQINDSLKLGGEVLQRIGRINRLHKPQVERAGFAVLKAPDIPSILVETAFISNPQEERKLRTRSYQEQMAVAIFDGVRGYMAANPALAQLS